MICSLANLPLKFHVNPSGSFCAKLLTDKQTNNDENISSLVEVTNELSTLQQHSCYLKAKMSLFHDIQHSKNIMSFKPGLGLGSLTENGKCDQRVQHKNP